MPVTSNYRVTTDNSLLSMRSPEDETHKPTLLLHINQRKVEAFIHSVIFFGRPLFLQQLVTSEF